MAKNKKRAPLSTEKKLYKAIQAIFILQARQLDMRNEDIRTILGVDKAEINAVAKLVNKSIKNGKSI